METTPLPPPPVAVSPPPSPAGRAIPVGASTPHDAAKLKWRRKSRQRANRLALASGKQLPWPDEGLGARMEGRASGGGGVGGETGEAPGGVDSLPPPAGGPAPVPWDASVLQPLFATALPELEKLAVASLAAQAAAIDPALKAEVARDAAWNPVAKATISATGPQVVAQTLNSVGMSAEHAPAVALVTACVAIFAGHRIMAAKLTELAAERRGPVSSPSPAEQTPPAGT